MLPGSVRVSGIQQASGQCQWLSKAIACVGQGYSNLTITTKVRLIGIKTKRRKGLLSSRVEEGRQAWHRLYSACVLHSWLVSTLFGLPVS
jgi:hypothetical protein